jgi:hypothetical protein
VGELKYFQKDAAGNILMGLHERFQNRFVTIIGIDPDLKATGYAQYDKRDKKLHACQCYTFFELLNTLTHIKNYGYEPKVIVEGGWLIPKANWHEAKEPHVRELIAKKVGENHATGKLIVEMLIHIGLPFQVVPPRKPIFEDEKFFKKVTGWKERTNKDARSAANYCFGY